MRAALSEGSKVVPPPEIPPKGGPEGPGQEESESAGLLRILAEAGFHIARRSHAAGAIISTGEDGPALCVLTSGVASLSRSRSAGKEATLGVLREWEVFGALEFAEDPIRRVQVRAVTPCEVAKLPRPLLEAAVERNPSVTLKLVSLQDAQLTRYEDFVARISPRTTDPRLAAILLLLAERFRESPPGSSSEGVPAVAGPAKIGVRFTQEELAAMIATTRESVAVAMGRLRRQGIIEVCDGTITVVDPEKLRDISGTQAGRIPRSTRV